MMPERILSYLRENGSQSVTELCVGLQSARRPILLAIEQLRLDNAVRMDYTIPGYRTVRILKYSVESEKPLIPAIGHATAYPGWRHTGTAPEDCYSLYRS